MRLSSSHIRSINRGIAQAEASAFLSFDRVRRRVPLSLLPAVNAGRAQMVREIAAGKPLVS